LPLLPALGKRLHSGLRAGLQNVRQLMCFAFANEIAHRWRRCQYFEQRHPARLFAFSRFRHRQLLRHHCA